MKNFLIRFKDSCIELSERPEIYLFTDESCTKSEWIPFDSYYWTQCQHWIMIKMIQEHNYNLINHEKIRFKLKNPEDINVFINWMSEYVEFILKKNYIKDIEYYEIDDNDYISDETITFLNSALVSMNDDYVEISADHILTSIKYEKDKTIKIE